MFIVYKDSKVFYKRQKGDGLPILFLHGWGGSTESFEYFAQGKNAILIDFPPFGKSESPKYIYDLNDYIEITKQILKKEKITKYHNGCFTMV